MRVLTTSLMIACLTSPVTSTGASFDGKHFAGEGDVEYLQLLDIAHRMFVPDPEFQNMAMLYMPAWNGLVEGPTWDAWWIQNSYGTTYCALPFCQEPFVTWLQNSQDLWFDQMGDGKRTWSINVAGAVRNWTPPDGALCDAARPGWFVAKQGDGRVDIHDWGMEFTAAGVVMQGELLLIARDRTAIAEYLPKLERCANFIETRRDPKNDLFLAGPAGNLLAPSYAGWKKPDGTYGMAYLAGLSVTYIAALDRLIELEKMAGAPDKVALYTQRRDAAKRGLANITTEDGYLLRSIDPDGTKHGLYGAHRHGYFEASPNHDAICFRVVDDAQTRRIFEKIAGIPELRPHAFIIPNYPSYDDMYEEPKGLWGFGTWVNGGHWSTCEARMMMAYYRLGQYEDARRSMRQLLTFAKRWRMDNPLTKFGSDVYQPKEPVNLCYDTFGPAAGFIRGLFEYRYDADGLTIVPHIPPGITRLQQRFPTRFGQTRIYLRVEGAGPVTSVLVGPRRLADVAPDSFKLRDADLPPEGAVDVAIGLGGREVKPGIAPDLVQSAAPPPPPADLQKQHELLERVAAAMRRAGLEKTRERAHAQVAQDMIAAVADRDRLLATGVLKPLPEPSAPAARKCYVDTINKLVDGLGSVLKQSAADPERQRLGAIWTAATQPDSRR